jgi:hypothetical protein
MYTANQYNKFHRIAFSFNMPPILISKIILHIWSWDNSVWYGDWAGAGWPTNHVWILAQARDLSLLIALNSSWGSFPEGKGY